MSGIAFDETNAEPVLFDADNDGDLDLYLTSLYPGRGSHFYLNASDGRLALAVGSADGVRLSHDGRVRIREIQAGRASSGSQDEAVAHFGLGNHAGRVEVAIRTS